MRYGICTSLENLELLERLGYDYIELSVTATMNLQAEVLEGCKEKLKNSSVKCEAFNILFPKTMELLGEHADEKDLGEYLHRAMAMIQELGGQVVVFGSGKCRNCPAYLSYKEAYEQLVKVYRITGDIAAEYGITVVIEPLSRKETNMICTIAEGALLEKDVAHPNVRLLADYFHMIANGDSMKDIETIRSFGHFHIASGNGRRYPLGQEGEQYETFMKALKAIGYDGRMSIEGKTDNLEQDAKTALSFLKKLEEQCDE